MTALTQDYSAFVTPLSDDLNHLDLAVEGVHCAGCIRKIETAVRDLPGVSLARLNFTDKRLAVEWSGHVVTPSAIIETLDRTGFKAHPFDPGTTREKPREDKRLLRAMGVAGFAAMNIMLLSVSVWSGNVSDITTETRDLFHWISALIALPTVAYAGQPFFESAIRAIKARSLNMDVPISLAVMLALVMSVVQTLNSAHHAYFDSAVMLLFFLLVGRYLDQQMRRKTRAAAETLLALKGETAERVDADGTMRTVPLSVLGTGDKVHVATGSRFPADGTISAGEAQVDLSLVTGETDAATVGMGEAVYAGALNVGAPVSITVTAAGAGTVLDEINRLIGRSLEARSARMQLADRAAKLYAPVVHLLAGLSFLGWLILGPGWEQALLIAVAVLIITCPCALGLAVPAAQVVASGALFRAGVVINAGDLLERLGEVDTVVFDKTGTLTLPTPRLLNAGAIPDAVLQDAATLARASRHPLARALAEAAGPGSVAKGAEEVAGEGVRLATEDGEKRLGRATFCSVAEEAPSGHGASVIHFIDETSAATMFLFGQSLREDAVETVASLRKRGLAVSILSGDRADAVRPVAETLNVADWHAGLSPFDKIAHLEALAAKGCKVLMVGDGLNDAPALAAAHASLSPISAVHVSQAAADGMILNDRLRPVVDAFDTSRKASAVMRQNLQLAALYNIIAVPIAVAGFVTPLVAALAMSSSSILVTLNSLRARAARHG
ncbi:MAG: heavy metal translocating P-type ATPase [Pseudomonadota bacterium]